MYYNTFITEFVFYHANTCKPMPVDGFHNNKINLPYHNGSHVLLYQSTTGQFQCDHPHKLQGVVMSQSVKLTIVQASRTIQLTYLITQVHLCSFVNQQLGSLSVTTLAGN